MGSQRASETLNGPTGTLNAPATSLWRPPLPAFLSVDIAVLLVAQSSCPPALLALLSFIHTHGRPAAGVKLPSRLAWTSQDLETAIPGPLRSLLYTVAGVSLPKLQSDHITPWLKFFRELSEHLE